MSSLHSCPSCSSLNPQGSSVCLNCDCELNLKPQRVGLVSRVLKGAGLVAISMTLTACYGGGDLAPECVDQDLDGLCDFEDCDDNDSNAECQAPETRIDRESAAGAEPQGGELGGAEDGGAERPDTL